MFHASTRTAEELLAFLQPSKQQAQALQRKNSEFMSIKISIECIAFPSTSLRERATDRICPPGVIPYSVLPEIQTCSMFEMHRCLALFSRTGIRHCIKPVEIWVVWVALDPKEQKYCPSEGRPGWKETRTYWPSNIAPWHRCTLIIRTFSTTVILKLDTQSARLRLT